MWSPEMRLTFLAVLEEQDNLGKRSDCGWKPEAWNECRDAVQKVYTVYRSKGSSVASDYAADQFKD